MASARGSMAASEVQNHAQPDIPALPSLSLPFSSAQIALPEQPQPEATPTLA